MTDTTFPDSPIFDELCEQFIEEFQYPLWERHLDPNMAPDFEQHNLLPDYATFKSSYTWEWLIYMPESHHQMVSMWNQSDEEFQQFVSDSEELEEPDRRSIAEALASIQSPVDNKALDEVMDVMFGKKEIEEEDPFFLTFIELTEEDQKIFLERALVVLKEEGIPFDATEMVRTAKYIYSQSPIKPMRVHTPIVPDVATAILGAIETGMVKVEADEEAEQVKFDGFWNQQTD